MYDKVGRLGAHGGFEQPRIGMYTCTAATRFSICSHRRLIHLLYTTSFAHALLYPPLFAHSLLNTWKKCDTVGQLWTIVPSRSAFLKRKKNKCKLCKILLFSANFLLLLLERMRIFDPKFFFTFDLTTKVNLTEIHLGASARFYA